VRAVQAPGDCPNLAAELRLERPACGTAGPGILAILDAAPEGAHVLLTAGDLFPAMVSAAAIADWAPDGHATALTAELCVTVETHRSEDRRPDRSQPAAFLLPPAARAALIAGLRASASGPDLGRDSPGWPALVTAILLGPAIGGTVRDSGLLLREMDTPPGLTAAHPALIDDLRQHLGIAADGPARMADRFRDHIRRICTAPGGPDDASTAPNREVMRALHLARPTLCDLERPAIRALVSALAAADPALALQGRLSVVADLAARALDQGDIGFAHAEAALAINPDPHHSTHQTLTAALFALRTARLRGAPLPAPVLPPGAFAEPLAAICARHQPAAFERRAVARLWARSLATGEGFAPDLFAYLMASCETPEQRALLTALRAETERTATDAPDAA